MTKQTEHEQDDLFEEEETPEPAKELTEQAEHELDEMLDEFDNN